MIPKVYKLIFETVKYKNSKDSNSVTPLHLSAKMGNFEMCKLIIENVHEKNPKDWRGDTPLHYAAQMGHVEVCELIIKNITMKNPPNSNSTVMIDNLSNSGSESESESEYDRSSDSDSESDFYVAPKRHKLSFDKVQGRNPNTMGP